MGGRRHYRDPGEWVELPNATPAIVPGALWEAAQAQLRRNLELSRRAAKRDYLLSGHVFCGGCGRRLHGWWAGKRRYYACPGSRGSYSPERCDAHVVQADGIEAEVWDAVGQIVRQPELIMAEVERLSDHEAMALVENRAAELEVRIRAVRNDEQRLVRLFGYGEIDESFILEETRRFKKERAGLEEEKARLIAQSEDYLNASAMGASIGQLVEAVAANLENAGYDEKRLGLEALQVRVTAGLDGELEIRLAVPIAVTRARSCHSNYLTFRCDHGAPVLVGVR
jgi:site-specific DNA recombinase